MALKANVPWDEVMDMTVPCLVNLVEKLEVQRSADLVERSWLAMVAAQGKEKDMRKRLKPHERRVKQARTTGRKPLTTKQLKKIFKKQG